LGQSDFESFTRNTGLQRHWVYVHKKHKQQRIDCLVKKCSRKGHHSFLRRVRNYHKKTPPSGDAAAEATSPTPKTTTTSPRMMGLALSTTITKSDMKRYGAYYNAAAQ
jgi:hypothetical protein